MITDSSHPKTLLVVNTGSQKKRFVFKLLRKLPNTTIVVLNKEKNWVEPYVDTWILADTNQHREAISAARKFHQEHRIDGVVTFWEDDVLLTSKIVDELGLIGIPWEVARQVRNKHDFRQFCLDNQLPAPKFAALSSPSELQKIINDFTFPIILKPAYGSSSAFVIKVDDPDELDHTFHFLRQAISQKTETALHEGLQLMAEEYIDGDEVDIDIIVQNGKIKFWSISDNFQTNEPFFVETAQSIPSVLAPTQQEQLMTLAEEVLEKLTIFNGCIHFEAKYSSTGPVPIEVNLRMGGDEVHSFVKSAWNFDLVTAAAQIALGNYIPKVIKPLEPYNYLFGKYFLSEKSGIISSVELPAKFDKELQVDQFHFYKQTGDSVYAPPIGYDYLGWITAKGDNPNDAERNLETAHKAVQFEIIPFTTSSVIGKTKRSSSLSTAKIGREHIQHQERLLRIQTISKKELLKLRIGIACNTFSGTDGLVEASLTNVGRKIEQTLNELGYTTTFIDFNNITQAIKSIQNSNLDLIFNVTERLHGSSLLEPHIASLLDTLQIPYTGSNPFTLSLCIDKIRVKKLLSYHNIPTAKWDYSYNHDDEIRTDFTYPLIVKPANTDNSIGITHDSVVTNPKQLKRQIGYVLDELKRPVLVEEYLPGDEYDVSIMGNDLKTLEVLPLSRTIFSDVPKGMWNIYPFDSKFGKSEDNKKYVTVERPPKKVSGKLLALMSEMALETYSILGANDYGRVEIKLDSSGNPHVLELNPNPSINLGDCVPDVFTLASKNRTYSDFLERIIWLAIQRYRNNPPYHHLQPGLM